MSADQIIGLGIWVVAFLGFAGAFWSASGWRLSARLMPQTAAATGLAVVGVAALMLAAARCKVAHPSPERRQAEWAGPPSGARGRRDRWSA